MEEGNEMRRNGIPKMLMHLSRLPGGRAPQTGAPDVQGAAARRSNDLAASAFQEDREQGLKESSSHA